LAESLKELYVTCDYLETQLARLRGALTGRIVGVAGLGVVLNHAWK
jgi:uncharacterized protein YunC (DUF1805 family)